MRVRASQLSHLHGDIGHIKCNDAPIEDPIDIANPQKVRAVQAIQRSVTASEPTLESKQDLPPVISGFASPRHSGSPRWVVCISAG